MLTLENIKRDLSCMVGNGRDVAEFLLARMDDKDLSRKWALEDRDAAWKLQDELEAQVKDLKENGDSMSYTEKCNFQNEISSLTEQLTTMTRANDSATADRDYWYKVWQETDTKVCDMREEATEFENTINELGFEAEKERGAAAENNKSMMYWYDEYNKIANELADLKADKRDNTRLRDDVAKVLENAQDDVEELICSS